MADIQLATAENRRRKEKEEETTGQKNIISASDTQGGHNETACRRNVDIMNELGIEKDTVNVSGVADCCILTMSLTYTAPLIHAR